MRWWTPVVFLSALVGHEAAASAGVELWTEAGIRYELSERLRLSFDQHVRFEEASGLRLKSVMPELSASYRVARFLRLKAGYRFVAKPEDSASGTSIYSWHRVFADVQLRLKWKPVRLKYRLRLQEQLGWTFTRGLELQHTLRNKISAEVRTGSGFTPFVSGEVLARLGDAQYAWRASVGTDWSSSEHVLTFLYRIEDAFDDDEEPPVHIFGLAYHFQM